MILCSSSAEAIEDVVDPMVATLAAKVDAETARRAEALEREREREARARSLALSLSRARARARERTRRAAVTASVSPRAEGTNTPKGDCTFFSWWWG